MVIDDEELHFLMLPDNDHDVIDGSRRQDGLHLRRTERTS
jgi:hypothetical protein